MPRYAYKCNVCLTETTLFHLIDEPTPACPSCTAGDLTKLLTSFSTKRRDDRRPNKVGEITEDFIQTASAELKEQKKKMSKKSRINKSTSSTNETTKK